MMNTKTLSPILCVLKVCLVISLLAGCQTPGVESPEIATETWEKFEARLEYLRQQMKIPGMSAAIVMDQKLIWAKGFGYADLENKIEATPDTLYHLASVTKTVAATLIMRLVQEGVISLDDPISKYGVELVSEGTILVRHLLMHASTGIPGTTYIYDGARYNYLGVIAERATGKPFATLVQERILNPAGMANTWMDCTACQVALDQSPYPPDWDSSKLQVAIPYQLNQAYQIIRGVHRSGFGAVGGLISSVTDLAKFDIALDNHVLLKEQTRAEMLAPAISMLYDRPDLSHGLGWYSTEFRGTRLNWHAGREPPSVSANIIKAPEQNVTFIIMANTDHLNVPYSYDITYSSLGIAFYETFVYTRQTGKAVPEVNWEAGEAALVHQLSNIANKDVRQILERELWAYRQLFFSVGKTDLVDQLLKVHQQVYPEYPPTQLDLYTSRGFENDVSSILVSDQVQLTEAEQNRLVGEYVLDYLKNHASFPLEVRFRVINGKLSVSYEGGCIDLVAMTTTHFTTPEQQIQVSFQMNGEEVEQVTVNVSGLKAVYLPPK